MNAAAGRRLPKAISGGLATGAMALSFGVAVAAVRAMLIAPPVAGLRSIDQVVYTWLASDRLNVPLAFHLDPLAALMILVVTGIGTLIHLYSTAYMHDETD